MTGTLVLTLKFPVETANPDPVVTGLSVNVTTGVEVEPLPGLVMEGRPGGVSRGLTLFVMELSGAVPENPSVVDANELAWPLWKLAVLALLRLTAEPVNPMAWSGSKVALLDENRTSDADRDDVSVAGKLVLVVMLVWLGISSRTRAEFTTV